MACQVGKRIAAGANAPARSSGYHHRFAALQLLPLVPDTYVAGSRHGDDQDIDLRIDVFGNVFASGQYDQVHIQVIALYRPDRSASILP